MSGPEAAQRYRVELHTFAGRHSERCFNNIDDAHAWILAGYAELPEAESAAVIFDDADGRHRVFVIDPNLVLPGLGPAAIGSSARSLAMQLGRLEPVSRL